MSTTGYLGPEGSYSQLAAQQFNAGPIKAYPSFHCLFKALIKGEVEGIVLPVENSLNGGVAQNLDLLRDTEGVIAVRESFLKIDHRLVTLNDATLGDIKRIYSHPQALGQCTNFICSRLPGAELITTSSTSACLSMLLERGDRSEAGIICAQPVPQGLKVWEECIADRPSNYTQFLYVIKGAPDITKHSSKIFLCLTCAHRPGALLSVLQVFARDGVNLTKIESRPIKDRLGEYAFFIEAEADYSLPKTQSALYSLRDMCSSIKILGCY